jgi:hypothetical protein
MLVGRNGRAYPPEWWPFSDTFRQGQQENLLVADNITRTYDSSTWPEKQFLVQQTWGRFIREENVPSNSRDLRILTNVSLPGKVR